MPKSSFPPEVVSLTEYEARVFKRVSAMLHAEIEKAQPNPSVCNALMDVEISLVEIFKDMTEEAAGKAVGK